MTEATEGAAAPDDAVPQAITSDEYDGCRAAILSNIEQGYADPLLGLSADTEELLLRLAYSDLVGLERLERICKAAIRDANQGEPAAKAFNLNTYKRGAAQLRRQIAEANARKAKMRERSLRLIQGGKEPGGTDVEMPDDSAISVQAMCEAQSVFLRACGLLTLFRKGRLWYDEFFGDYFTDWDGSASDDVIPARKIDDAFFLSVHEYLLMMDVKLGQSGTSNTEKAIHRVADQDRRSEPRAWLESLEWDGTERLPFMLREAYGTPQNDYYAAVGRCWFVSMAARIMAPGCKVDTMPVLFGPQGTGKSSSLEIIGGRYYATINTSADGKDFFDALRGVLVAEIAEFDAFSSNRVENSRIKTLLSTATDRYRKSYGRTTQDYLRTAVLAATTNDQGWHRDETGGRRFWPIHCEGQINLAWLREHREQLFAEALHRYRAGESWYDVPRDVQEAMIAEHYSGDPWEERISAAIASWRVHTGVRGDKVEPTAGTGAVDGTEQECWGTLVTTDRILTAALRIEPARQQRRDKIRVASAMRKMGWRTTTVRIKGAEKPTRCWLKDATGDDLFDK